jgi:hypothetical protein
MLVHSDRGVTHNAHRVLNKLSTDNPTDNPTDNVPGEPQMRGAAADAMPVLP